MCCLRGNEKVSMKLQGNHGRRHIYLGKDAFEERAQLYADVPSRNARTANWACGKLDHQTLNKE
jgi:hypothetical protein